MDILPGDVRNALPVTIRIAIENDAHLLPLALVSKPLASQEQAQFERHVETRKPCVHIQADVRNVVYAVPALLDNAPDLD